MIELTSDIELEYHLKCMVLSVKNARKYLMFLVMVAIL